MRLLVRPLALVAFVLAPTLPLVGNQDGKDKEGDAKKD